MPSLEEFYNKVKLPISEELLKQLLEKFFSIPLHKTNYQDELYTQINRLEKTIIDKEKIKQEKAIFLQKLNQDFINAGRPFNPATHEGLTNPLGVQAGWLTFKSWNLLGGEKIHANDQIHRLYINVPSNDRMAFANALYDEFKRNNTPFYFKVEYFDEDRPDKVVIYTSTQLLEKTLVVLDNMAKRRPDLINNCKSPSIITGKVTDKIGYASEVQISEAKGKSYTEIICEAFVSAIETTLDEYRQRSSISDAIYEIHQSKLQEARAQGIVLDEKIRRRIASEVLSKNEPNFNRKLLIAFRANIQKMGLDPDNMCFSKEAKYQIQNLIRVGKKDSDLEQSISSKPMIKSYSFEEIEYLFNNFNIIKDSNGEYKVIDIRTNAICEEKELVAKVKFAHTWVAATRYERSLDAPYSKVITKLDYATAFNAQAKEVYEYIMAIASINMKAVGVLINPITLEKEITNYVVYTRAKSIVRGLYSKERFAESFKNWLRMANDMPIIEEDPNWHR